MEWRSRTTMLGRGGPDSDVLEICPLPWLQLHHSAKALPAKEPAGPRSADHGRIPIKHSQAWAVEMVEMVMGEENHVGPIRSDRRTDVAVTAKVKDPMPENGIGEDARSALFDQDR